MTSPSCGNYMNCTFTRLYQIIYNDVLASIVAILQTSHLPPCYMIHRRIVAICKTRQYDHRLRLHLNGMSLWDRAPEYALRETFRPACLLALLVRFGHRWDRHLGRDGRCYTSHPILLLQHQTDGCADLLRTRSARRHPRREWAYTETTDL